MSTQASLLHRPTTHLDSRVRDPNRLENLIQVIRHQSVTGPLREECQGDDDPHPLPITDRCKQRRPADVRSNTIVKLQRGLDFLVFVFHQWIVPAYVYGHDQSKEEDQGTNLLSSAW